MTTQKLTRYAYQNPQTSMERHVAELVAHLRDGFDSQAGFAAKMEAAQAHAFWLEKSCIEMREEVKRLERALMPRLPDINCWGKEVDTRDPRQRFSGGSLYFEWGMETIRYRAIFNGYDQKDDHTLKQVKRRAFKDLAKRFREQFEKTWTLNTARYQRRAG